MLVLESILLFVLVFFSAIIGLCIPISAPFTDEIRPLLTTTIFTGLYTCAQSEKIRTRWSPHEARERISQSLPPNVISILLASIWTRQELSLMSPLQTTILFAIIRYMYSRIENLLTKELFAKKEQDE
jgi:hypothetical protein